MILLGFSEKKGGEEGGRRAGGREGGEEEGRGEREIGREGEKVGVREEWSKGGRRKGER